MPSLQQHAIKMTKEAVGGLFRAAKHVPADKQNDWKPMGEARSVLSQATECALSAFFFAAFLKGEKVDFADPAAQEKRKQAEAAITSVEIAEQVALKHYEVLYATIAEIADEDLDKPCPMPWNPETKVSDVMFYAHWNLVYHIGQINYIQLLLGDTEMRP